MHRWPAYLLSLSFLLLGTGAFQHLHNQAHAEALGVAAAGEHVQAPRPDSSEPVPTPFEHERDCPLHLMLGTPLLDQAGSAAIVWESTSQWTLAPAQAEPADSRLPARVDCRGPPFLLSR